MNRTPRTTRSPSIGFTLIEVLIALALMLALVAVMWSLFASFSRMEDRGLRATRDIRVIGYLHRQFQEDFSQVLHLLPEELKTRSVDLPPPPDSSLTDVANDEAVNGETVDDETVDDETFGAFQESLGLPVGESALSIQEEGVSVGDPFPKQSLFEGTSSRLKFLVLGNSQQRRLFDRSLSGTETTIDIGSDGEAQASRLRRPHFLLISYEWKPEDLAGPDAEQFAVDTEFEAANPNELEPKLIFTRTIEAFSSDPETNASESDFADPAASGFETMEIGRQQSDNPSIESVWDTREVAQSIPEIEEIRFRYFDGSSWKSSWRTPGVTPSQGRSQRQTPQLPLAVEIIFKLTEPEKSNASKEDEASESEVDLEMEIGESEFEDDISDPAFDQLESNLPLLEPGERRIVVHLGTGMAYPSASPIGDAPPLGGDFE